MGIANIGIGAINHAIDVITSARADSLIEYSKPARVEPTVLVDSDVIYASNDITLDVMQTLQSLFAGYYLQAVALSAQIGNVNVLGTLDKFNPERDPINAAMGNQWGNHASSVGLSLLSQESYTDALPYFGKPALEEGEVAVTKDAIKEATAISNLSVGKMLSVEITNAGHKGTFPISLRLLAVDIPTQNLVHILSLGNRDLSMKERYHQWRAGQIEFFRDFVLCLDLIEKHRKELMEDANGAYSGIVRRQRNNQISAIVSGNPSVATASNMVVTSANTIAQLELEINAKFSDFRTREKIFKETSLMIVAVIDTQWDRVTFYHRSLPDATSLSFKALKAANKGDGPDIAQILKAYSIGHNPTF